MLNRKPQPKMKKTDQVLFLKELAELSKAGYSLEQALIILVDSHEGWRCYLVDIQAKLAAGEELSKVFAPLFEPGIRIYLHLAKEQGRFSETLQELANKMQLLIDYQRQLKLALAYPAALLVVLFGLVFGLEKTLYPIFATLSDELGENSEGNLALIGLHALVVLVTGVTLFVLLTYFWLSRQRPLKRCRLVGRIPFIAPLSKSLLSALVAEQLSLLLSAGLTLPGVIRTVAALPKQEVSLSKEMAKDIQVLLNQGKSISDWIAQEPFLDTTLAVYLERGFERPLLATYLAYYAKHEFRSFDRSIKRLFAWLQPILFAVIGVAIVLLYLAMLLPLYQNLGGLPT